MKTHQTLWLSLFFLFVPALIAGYPNRDQLLQEIERLEGYLQKAQAADGPQCTPESLALAQSHLARAKEEYQEGDLWKAEDAIRLCKKEAEGLWEEILVCGRDLDGDQIPDRKDRCPTDPETYNGYADEDGCPDRLPRRAVLTDDKIEILVPIPFDEDTQRPLVDSDSVLIEVARIIDENPDLRFRIEAHLDNRMPPEQANHVTKLRAFHVKSALVDLGVAESRLEAEGKGSREPIASNDSSWGRLLNRRVEIIRIP